MKTSDLSRACLQGYVDKDRSAAEALIATDFHFTSPIDNLLDRATYFARCWPNSESMRVATVVATADDGNQAFVVYEAETGTKRFRNCAHLPRRQARVRGGVLRMEPPSSGCSR